MDVDVAVVALPLQHWDRIEQTYGNSEEYLAYKLILLDRCARVELS